MLVEWDDMVVEDKNQADARIPQSTAWMSSSWSSYVLCASSLPLFASLLFQPPIISFFCFTFFSHFSKFYHHTRQLISGTISPYNAAFCPLWTKINGFCVWKKWVILTSFCCYFFCLWPSRPILSSTPTTNVQIQFRIFSTCSIQIIMYGENVDATMVNINKFISVWWNVKISDGLLGLLWCLFSTYKPDNTANHVYTHTNTCTHTHTHTHVLPEFCDSSRLSISTGGKEEALVPNTASISSEKGQDLRPWPVSPFESLIYT